MAKIKTTQKAIKDDFKNVICVGYANLQTLLGCENPLFYTVCREGWGCDVYIFNDTAIATGYAPFGKIKADYDLCVEYEKIATEISNKYFNFSDRQQELRTLINCFINEVANND